MADVGAGCRVKTGINAAAAAAAAAADDDDDDDAACFLIIGDATAGQRTSHDNTTGRPSCGGVDSGHIKKWKGSSVAMTEAWTVSRGGGVLERDDEESLRSRSSVSILG